MANTHVRKKDFKCITCDMSQFFSKNNMYIQFMKEKSLSNAMFVRLVLLLNQTWKATFYQFMKKGNLIAVIQLLQPKATWINMCLFMKLRRLLNASHVMPAFYKSPIWTNMWHQFMKKKSLSNLSYVILNKYIASAHEKNTDIIYVWSLIALYVYEFQG